MKTAFCFFSKLLIISFLTLFSAQILRGQNPVASTRNLVVNPSFEVRAETKSLYRTIYIIDTVSEFLGWTSTYATINLLQSQIYGSDKNGNIFDNTETYGQRDFKAMTGSHVGSLEVCCVKLRRDGVMQLKRSYLEGELKMPLEVGQKYYVGFGLHYHCISVTGMGIAFELKENVQDTSARLHLKPVAYQKQLWDYNVKQPWLMIVDSFIADVAFKNFYIGNFFGNDSTATSGSKDFGHYLAFVDDVFVIKANDNKMPPPKPKPVPPSPPLPKVLNKVQFEYNSAQFVATSMVQLDSAVLTLQRYTKLKILIKGHTSGEGNAEHNQKLSENRAEAVLNYLVSKGIAADRLQAKGYGSILLLVEEKTEEDRKINRRIEFEVLKE